MKKTIQTLILVLITVAFANIASADQQEDASVVGQDQLIQFTPQQLVDLCTNVRDRECDDSNALTADELYKIRMGLAQLEEAKGKARATSKARKSRLAKLEERVKALENASKPGADENALQEQINALRDELGALANEPSDTAAIDGLRKELEALGLREDARELKRDETQLEDSREIKEILGRVNALEAALDPFEFGIYGGFAAFTAIDSTSYTGGLVLGEFTYRVNADWDIIADVGLLLSGGEAPLGTYVRGAFGRRLDTNFRFDLGASTSWVGYDRRVEAAAMSLLIGPGVRYVADCGFSLTANIGGGAAFAPTGAPDANFGGNAAAGWVIR